MNKRWAIGIVLTVVLLNIVAYSRVVRWDMTDDARYSLNPATKELVRSLEEPMTVSIYLDGELNSGFRRLQTATIDLCEELSIYADIEHQCVCSADAEKEGLHPVVIHEREQNGKTAQTMVYPYMRLSYRGKSSIINLLSNTPGLSGEENLNRSIESLEYQVAEAIHTLKRTETARIAFLEGHSELPEQNVLDVTMALSRYFQVDRGVLGSDPTVLDDYKAVIIADPQQPFSEADKYILDRYIGQGGNVLWLVNGVQFSEDVLSAEGFTPIIAQELNLTDIFFRYGIRLAPALVQDQQCLPIPVNVAPAGEQPNYQPFPWYYAPLLLTSQASPVTRGIAEINSSFVSPIEVVGGDDGLRKEILIASSSASRLIGTPAEVDLTDLNPDKESFQRQFIPVGVSVEGVFPSVFAHRMTPEGIEETTTSTTRTRARQVFIGAGSIIRNEWQQGQPLPAGYDRYSRMQFGNRDLIVNLVLWLTDEGGLIELRGKEVALRLLNDRRAHDERLKIQIISTIVPVLVLALLGIAILLIRKRKYTRS